MIFKYENELVLLDTILYDLTAKKVISYNCLDFSSSGSHYLYIDSKNIAHDENDSFFSNVTKCYCEQDRQYVLLDTKRCFARQITENPEHCSSFYKTNNLSIFKDRKKTHLFNHTIYMLKHNRVTISSNVEEDVTIPILKLKDIINVFYNSKLDKIIFQKSNFDLLITNEHQLQNHNFKFVSIKAENIHDWIEYQLLV